MEVRNEDILIRSDFSPLPLDSAGWNIECLSAQSGRLLKLKDRPALRGFLCFIPVRNQQEFFELIRAKVFRCFFIRPFVSTRTFDAASTSRVPHPARNLILRRDIPSRVRVS